MQKPRISIVAALGQGARHSRVIGRDNRLIWHIPADLKRFKDLTLGHPVVMGRKTFESILATLGKPLPGRANIVVTRDPHYQHEGALVTHSLEEALEKARALDSEEIFIGGGSQLYTEALPQVDRLYLTLIDDDPEGDTYFPEYEDQFTKVLLRETRHEGVLAYEWVTLERE
jgi:dihydrofolate reductase